MNSLQEPGADAASEKPIAVVVDPDQLMRWSLQSYLGRWYDVRLARTAWEGCAMIDEMPAGRLGLAIVADGLSDAPADEVIHKVQAHSPRARIVQTVTQPTRADGLSEHSVSRVRVLAKPFRLEALDAIAAR